MIDNAQQIEQRRLTDLVEILPGYPFRGAIQPDPNGDVYVAQLRHADPDTGVLSTDQLERTTLKGRRTPDYLQDGDILFLAKGPRNYAVTVQGAPAQTVCTPHFFHLKLRPSAEAKVLPAFIAWQINQPKAQAYFARTGQGSVVSAVTKTQLAELMVSLPSIQAQQQLIKLVDAATREKQLMQQLLQNRQQQIQAVSQQLLNPTESDPIQQSGSSH